MKINRDTDIAIFVALFNTVKEVLNLLKLYLTNAAHFIKSADIYMVITP